MIILVIDVGGTNIKLKLSDSAEVRKVASGPNLTAQMMVADVLKETADWKYDAVSIGYPGPVVRGTIALDPVNLGPGWLGHDFSALGKQVKVINDAAMQALGSYEGGRMLFLGLGTGLGSTLIIDGAIAPMELGHLPYKKGRTFEEYVGAAGMRRLGKKKWQEIVFDVVARLKHALQAEYVVLGGGNTKKLEALPPGSRAGDNSNAFIGGVRLWQQESK
jgi:predicted NBD/HSP70 family sugar kinase